MARSSYSTATVAFAVCLALLLLQCGCEALRGHLVGGDDARAAGVAGAIIGGTAGGPGGALIGEAVGYGLACLATAYGLHKRKQTNRLRATLNGQHAGPRPRVTLVTPRPNATAPPRATAPPARRTRRG